jgi:hypothetical protein
MWHKAQRILILTCGTAHPFHNAGDRGPGCGYQILRVQIAGWVLLACILQIKRRRRWRWATTSPVLHARTHFQGKTSKNISKNVKYICGSPPRRAAKPSPPSHQEQAPLRPMCRKYAAPEEIARRSSSRRGFKRGTARSALRTQQQQGRNLCDPLDY